MKKMILNQLVVCLALAFSPLVLAVPQTEGELTADTVPSSAPGGAAAPNNGYNPYVGQQQESAAAASVQGQAQAPYGAPQHSTYGGGGYGAPYPQQQGVGQQPQYGGSPVVERRTVVQAASPQTYQATEQAARQQTNAEAQTKSPVERFWNMSDKEIREMKKRVEEKQAAIHQDVSPNRCIQREILVNGSPNEQLPFITLDPRNKTNMMFVDKAGTPYPIHYVMNNERDVVAQFDVDDPEASILYVNTTTDYAYGNFTVKLADNPVPLVFVYAANQRNTDCMVTVRLNSLSKRTAISHKPYNPRTLDASLNSTLFGVAPPNSRPLKVSHKDFSVWLQKNGQVVIRTRHTILSPMPKTRIGSPDGTFVFTADRSSVYLYKDGEEIKSFTVSFY